MKRKLLTLVMAASMVFAGGIFACAQEAENTTEVNTAEDADAEEAYVLNWADFEEQINASEEAKDAWAGDFVEMDEIAMKMYVPNSFEQVELSDEDREDGYIAYFTLGEDAAIGVQYVNVDEMSLEEYKELLASELEINAAYVTVNDLPALSYTFTTDDSESAVLAFATEQGYLLEISFAPVNDEGFSSVALVLMASVQAAE